MDNIGFILDKVNTVSDFFGKVSDFFEANKHIIYWGDFMIDLNSSIAYIGGIILVALILFILTKPVKWIFKTVFNGLLGGIMLLIINYMGASIGLNIPINPISALVAGVLGFPGVILLVLIGLIL